MGGMDAGRVPTGATRQLITTRATDYTVYRFSDGVDGWGERADEFTTQTARLDLSFERRAERQRPTGIDHSVAVGGACLPSEPIEEGDVIRYSGRVLELQSKEAYPANGTAEFYTLTFRDESDVDPTDLP